MATKILKTCTKGHQFHKTKDCNSCPICEAEKKPESGWLINIAAPARRALAQKGIKDLNNLSKFTEADISTLHGMGPNAITKLKKALAESNLTFRKNG